MRVKRELIFAVVGLGFGFFLLPWLVYLVGQSLFGTYGGGAHKLGSFYGELFKNLSAGEPDSWGLVVGPYVVLSLLRLIFFRRTASEPEAPKPKPIDTTPKTTTKPRKEPTLTL